MNPAFAPARAALAVASAAAVAGTVLRFIGLPDRDFWFDESCTFLYVWNLFDWPFASSLLKESTNLPYYFLLRLWAETFGDSEAAYRSFSALCAALTVPLLATIAWRLRGATAGAVGAVLAAFHPLHVYYAREARTYALWMLVLTVALALLVEACRRGGKWWIAYGAALFGCLHLHYWTAYFVPCTAAGVLLATNRRGAFRAWLTTTVIVALAFVPYFFAAVLPAARGGGNLWIEQAWSPATAILETLWAFMPAGAYPAHLRGLSLASPDATAIGWPTLVRVSETLPAIIVTVSAVCLVLAAVRRSAARTPFHHQTPRSSPTARDRGFTTGVPATAAQARGRPFHADSQTKRGFEPLGRTHVLLAALTAGPLVLAWLYSALVRPNYLVGRYDLVAWPAAIVWMSLILTDAFACVAGRARMLALQALCGLLILCSLVPIARCTTFHPPPSFHRLRAEHLAGLAGPKDAIITLSYDRDYLYYYLHRTGYRGSLRAFPSWLSGQIGWLDTDADLLRIDEARADADALAASVAEILSRGGRVWLLADSLDPNDESPRAALRANFVEALTRRGCSPTAWDDELLAHELRCP